MKGRPCSPTLIVRGEASLLNVCERISATKGKAKEGQCQLSIQGGMVLLVPVRDGVSSVRTFVHMVHHMAPTAPCGNTVHGEQHRSLLWLDHGPSRGHQQHQTLFLKYLEMVVMANCEF